MGAASIAVLTRYLGPERLRPVHARADVHAAVRGAGRRGPVHHGRARDQQGPLAHRGAGGQHAHAAAAAVAGGDRAGRPRSACCCPTSPTCAWRSCWPAARCCSGCSTSSLRRGPAVAAADGPGGDRRRGRAGPRARRWSCSWPALDLGFYAVMGAAAGGALATLVVTWALTAAWSRRALPRRAWRSGARCCVAGLPLGLALAINALYFRADTLIISLYEPYDQVGLYTLAYRILELDAGGRHGLPEHRLPAAVARPWPTTSRARAARSRAPPTLLVVLGAAAGGRRAWCSRREIVELAAGEDFAGRRRAAAHPARGRRAGLGQRGVRLRADRQGAPGERALAERLGAGLQRRAELPARAALRHSGGGGRHGRLRDADPGRLLLADAPPLRLLPAPAHAGAGARRRGGRWAACCGCCATLRPAHRRRWARRSTRGVCCGDQPGQPRGGHRPAPSGERSDARGPTAAARAARHPQLVPRRRPDGAGRLRAGRLRPPSTPAASVLDLGCGLGGYSKALAERGFERARVRRGRRVRRARARAGRGAPSSTTASALPLADG